MVVNTRGVPSSMQHASSHLCSFVVLSLAMESFCKFLLRIESFRAADPKKLLLRAQQLSRKASCFVVFVLVVVSHYQMAGDEKCIRMARSKECFEQLHKHFLRVFSPGIAALVPEGVC